MPIALTQPITGPVVTRKEIVGFSIDLQAGTLSMKFDHLTAEAETVGSSSCSASLYAPDGQPRFSLELYGQIKQSLYAIAIEDGCVAGVVE